jgi:hypothetical protein
VLVKTGQVFYQISCHFIQSLSVNQASEEAYMVSITKIGHLIMHRRTTPVLIENKTKPINILSGRNVKLLNVKVAGTHTCNYHCPLEA